MNRISKSAIVLLALAWSVAWSTTVSARTVTCRSYSGLCKFRVQYPLIDQSVHIEVLNHSRGSECELSPGQTMTLKPSEDPTSGRGWLAFDSYSPFDDRWVKLRFVSEVWRHAVFDMTLEISLRSNRYAYVGNALSCR